MKNHVVDTYENYKEEDRLTTNNARRIEFETTVRVMQELIGTDKKILDCAAGTGVYAFHFADRGHEVTATDITPRHVEILNRILQEKNYKISLLKILEKILMQYTIVYLLLCEKRVMIL